MKMVAYCGIDCAHCPAYRLPRLGERLHMRGLFQRLLESGMRRARKRIDRRPDTRNQKPETLNSGYIICDGCTAIDARCLRPCLACPVRCCAMETGVENCAHCPKFPCDSLRHVWQTTVFKDVRARAEGIHARRQQGAGQQV